MRTYIKKERKVITCPVCGKTLKGKSTQIYCSSSCAGNKSNIKTGLVGVKPGTVGAMAELAVAVDLMRSGYDVYRSLSYHCHADLIAIKGDEVRKLEVRTGYYYLNALGIKVLRCPKHRTAGKEFVIYTHSDNKVHYGN